MRKIGLTGWILIAMAAGVVTGLSVHYHVSSEGKTEFSSGCSVITDIFLRLIKMIIAPLVFTTLVVGIAKLGDIKAVGRIGGKTLLWFVSASLLSLLFGLLIMHVSQLGSQLNLPLPPSTAVTGIESTSLSFKNFITHVFPRSVIESMANNEILQIVVFSIFFGVATAAIGETGKIVVRALDAVAHVILKMTGYVMSFAPVAALAAIASVVAVKGPELLITYGKFIIVFYLSILGLWLLLMAVASLFIGRKVILLMGAIKDAVLLAFSTASSESAFPRLIVELEKFGCPPKIVSFVLPLGYSFMLGSIAQSVLMSV